MTFAAAEPFTPSFFKQLQQLKIRTRRAYLGSRQGGHTSQRRGQGLEFAEFRPYVSGDDFRYIDWGVYGRTDRVYVRQFRAEQDLNVAVLIDTSASMSLPEGEGKFDMARNIALALGYIALTDGDTVTFSMLGKKNLPRLNGPASVSRAIGFLKEAKSGGAFHMLTEVRAAMASQRTPGKCFLISDFLFEKEQCFEVCDFLRSRNFEVVLVQVIAPSERVLNIELGDLVVDAETGESVELALDTSSVRDYGIKLSQHIDAIERYAQHAGIVHLLVASDERVQDVVLRRFPESGILK